MPSGKVTPDNLGPQRVGVTGGAFAHGRHQALASVASGTLLLRTSGTAPEGRIGRGTRADTWSEAGCRCSWASRPSTLSSSRAVGAEWNGSPGMDTTIPSLLLPFTTTPPTLLDRTTGRTAPAYQDVASSPWPILPGSSGKRPFEEGRKLPPVWAAGPRQDRPHDRAVSGSAWCEGHRSNFGPQVPSSTEKGRPVNPKALWGCGFAAKARSGGSKGGWSAGYSAGHRRASPVGSRAWPGGLRNG
jgi:hypothetical protein